MANVNITFNGKEFLLSCDNGQEEHLIELSEQLNNKFASLKSQLGNIGENKKPSRIVDLLSKEILREGG